MEINLISIGDKMPSWVKQGFAEYAKRLPNYFRLKLVEIPAEKRTKNADLVRIKELEGQKLLAALPKQSKIIALTIQGKAWSTEQLAQNLIKLQLQTPILSLLIGGPEGLANCCYQQANYEWSLSPLTFPHPLVRILVAEQLYRAWSIIKHHPYNR